MKAAKVRPISALKLHTKELVSEVAEGGAPVLITQNGQPRVVMIAAAEHDRLQATLAMLKLLAQSHESVRTSGRVSMLNARRRAKASLANARRR